MPWTDVNAPLVAAVLAAGISVTATTGSSLSPFAFFAPGVPIEGADRAKLDTGEVVVKVLPARDRELAVFAAVRVNALAERLIAWTRAIAELKRSRFVLAIRRFSDPPVLGDLEGLVLDQGDLDAVRHCRPGDCGVKLAADDIQSLRAASVGGHEAVQQEFRRLLLQRANAYRAGGLDGLPLGGLLGGLKRALIEGRLRSESEAVVRVVRSRLEGGDPGDGSTLAAP